MKPLAKFATKSGKKIEIWEPSMDRLPELLEFVNHLVKEDTFLTLTGELKTLDEERRWLDAILRNIQSGKTFLIWAIYQDKIIGQCDVVRGETREWHVGNIGLMVDKDFRQDGIGKFLIEYILKQAKKMKIKIATLIVFGDNEIAIALYKKFGFKEWGKLPNGLFRKGKYSDSVKMYKEL